MKKIYLIELLRFLSSIGVILHHYEIFFFRFNELNNIKISDNFELLPLNHILKLFYIYGDYGVQMFWCISGFIISYIYLDRIKSNDAKKFFVNRFSRLYPLHFITLIFVALLQLLNLSVFNKFMIFENNDLYHFVLNILFISSWGLEKGMSFNQPIWSVSFELIVYILFFLTVLGFKKLNLIKLIVIYVLILLLNKSNFLYDQSALNILVSDQHNDIISCIQLFLSGMIIYRIYKLDNKFFLLVFSNLLLGISLIGNFKIFIFCPALIMAVIAIENYLSINNKSVKNILSTMGQITYSCYLIHFPVALIVIMSVKEKTEIFLNQYFLLGYLFFIILISIFVYFLIEKKLQKKIRDKLLK